MAVAYVADSGRLDDGDTYSPLNEGGTNRLVLGVSLVTDSNGTTTLTDHQLDGVTFTGSTLLEDISSVPDLFLAYGYFLDGVATAGVYDVVIASSQLNDGGAILELQGVDQTTPIDTGESQIVFDENTNAASFAGLNVDYAAGDMIVVLASSSDDAGQMTAPDDLDGTDAFTTRVTDDTEFVGGGMPEGRIWTAVATAPGTGVNVQPNWTGTVDDVAMAILVVKAGSGHTLLADDLESASEVGTPAIGQTHDLLADDTESASEVGTPVVGQTHDLLADDTESASEVSAPVLVELGAHALLAEDIESRSQVSIEGYQRPTGGYFPRPVPMNASPELRAYLDDELANIAYRINALENAE